MNLGIVISSTKAETNWNVLRLANLAIEKGDTVKIFLMGEGVEYEKSSSGKFNVKEQVQKFIQSDRSTLLACGTCLKIRNQESSEVCPISTLKDFYDVVAWSDKILTF